MLVCDPRTGEISGIETECGFQLRKWGGIAALDGVLYCAPSSAEELLSLKISDRLSTILAGSVLELAPEYRLHYVAAELSRWVYAAEEALPAITFGSEHVLLELNAVESDPQKGITTRVAVVTASIPGMEPTLFIVFRGTDDLYDILTDLQLAPDYSQIGDGNTFVHGGMSTVVSNLGVFLRQGFIRQLELAFRAGVRHCVATGHSLGGAYSTMLLFKVQQELINGGFEGASYEAQALLRGLQSVAFGAPMSFGQLRRNIAAPAWMRECLASRAVNYMMESDPVPRCYGEVDLGRLVDAIVAQLKSGAGGFRPLVDIAVDGAVEAVKEKGLPFLQRIASLYVHFARVRVLRGKDVPLSSSAYDFDAHGIDAYRGALQSVLEARGDEKYRLFEVESRRLL